MSDSGDLLQEIYDKLRDSGQIRDVPIHHLSTVERYAWNKVEEAIQRELDACYQEGWDEALYEENA